MREHTPFPPIKILQIVLSAITPAGFIGAVFGAGKIGAVLG
jgi:hypothetical protein